MTKMETKVGKFTFTVPEGHPSEGEKVEKGFSFQVCQNEDEAKEVMEKRKLNITSMVNDNLKKLARSNAYQAAMLPYKPSEVSPEDIQERMVRDWIRMGKTEAQARKIVQAALAEETADEDVTVEGE
jgi:hypothetical protein